jgi:hypothetical protein
VGAALRQPARDHRPCRTGTDDDVVIGLVARHCLYSPSPSRLPSPCKRSRPAASRLR